MNQIVGYVAYWFVWVSVGILITISGGSIYQAGQKYGKTLGSRNFQSTGRLMIALYISTLGIPALLAYFNGFFISLSVRYLEFVPGILFIEVGVFDGWGLRLFGRKKKGRTGLVYIPLVIGIILILVGIAIFKGYL